MRTAIFAALALILAPAAAQAGDLAGKVYDATALPVAGATVWVGDREVQSLADGTYSITGLAAGEHEIAVTLADGAVQTVWAEVNAEGTSRRNIFLVSSAAMRGARQFASESAPTSAPVIELPQAPAGEGAVVAWRWRDSDA